MKLNTYITVVSCLSPNNKQQQHYSKHLTFTLININRDNDVAELAYFKSLVLIRVTWLIFNQFPTCFLITDHRDMTTKLMMGSPYIT